jgi:hypothetical protein
MKTRLLISVLLLALYQPSMADTPSEKSESFFQSIIKGDVTQAYDQLFIGSSIPKDKPQAVTLLKQQTKTGLPFYGEIINYELVSKEEFGKSLTRLVYILKSEKHPTIWELYFYKPKNNWVLSNIQFNDQFSFLSNKK